MAGPPRIVIIDDNPDDRALVARELRKELPNVQLIEVADNAEFQRVLAQEQFTLVVTDFALRWSDGLHILRTVKSTFPDCVVIMFTGTGNQEIAVQAMKEGLDDYIVKSPAHFVRLGASVIASLKRQQMQRRATLLELRQQQLLNRLSIAVFRLTMEGRLLECNPAFLHMVGVSTFAEAQELTLPTLRLPTKDAERLTKLPRDGAHTATWEAHITAADGKARVLAVNATLSTATGGDVVVDCLAEDISERIRTVEQLQAASKAKDEFLAVLSHELRTPLTPVVSISSMLEKLPNLPAEIRDDITIIRRNAELEVRLIDDLLDLTRVAKGKLLLDLRAIDVHPILEQAWHTCCPLDAERQHLRFITHLNAPRHVVYGDESRLQQVFMNIMTNAVKFTPEGGEITVTTRNADSAIVIEIADTGIGIEADLLGRLFTAFEQGEGPHQRRFRGLGLGLSIARRLVEMHKGAISAASPGKNEGTRFTITLPLHEGAVTPAASAPPTPRGRPIPLNILLVEDHPDTARAVKRLLEMLGHHVTTAGSIASALDVFAARNFDLLLSEIGLPDGRGTDLARRVAESPRPIPAIALSGFGTEADIESSRSAGFVAHLTKPVNIDQLERALNQFGNSGKS